MAHLYLSGDSDGIRTGNFIGDYVKGNQYNRYKGDIRKGILLHRAIDSYTDKHPAFAEAKEVFRNDYGRYSGIVADMVFDHLLASRWNEFSGHSLPVFIRQVHTALLSVFLNLPFRVQQFLPIMISHRRLESYATVEGTQKALSIMSKYSTLPDQSLNAAASIHKNRNYLDGLFDNFMKDITAHVESDHGIAILRPIQKGILTN